MKTLYCLMGGLMEDPGRHWEAIGEASGESLKEVADNYAAQDVRFEKLYSPDRLTYWGWPLSIDPAPANIKKE